MATDMIEEIIHFPSHIQGAENIYTEESILGLLRARHSAATNIKRNILIFHCEFSTERGPTKQVLVDSIWFPPLNYSWFYIPAFY